MGQPETLGELKVYWDGNLITDIGLQPLAWQLYTFDVTASTNATALEFSGINSGRTSFTFLGLDDVSVTPVPLPAALPLFASGLAGLGWLARRRKRA